jgi:ATP-dependent Clp protease ATP-binding subunit ClpB
VERAHTEVFNILLEVLDDGRLTDGQGRTVNFRNTVIVMTSNLGSQLIQEMAREGYDKMKQAVMEIVGQHFRPEFINRIDETVVFHSLDKAQIHAIADIQIERLVKRLAEKDIKLSVAENAVDFLANIGFDPVYGARPLKRAVQNYLENPLAQEILAGKFLPGDKIKVTKGADKLQFKK